MKSKVRSLSATAKLFGWLLVQEPDQDLLASLRDAPLRQAFAHLDIQVPTDDLTLAQVIDQFRECFSGRQQSTPLLQSLWVTESNEGPVAELRKRAAAAELELDPEAGTPVDHLGSILQLWAHFADSWPEHAAGIATHHLPWAHAPLARVARHDSFYGQLAAATAALIQQILAATDADAGTDENPATGGE